MTRLPLVTAIVPTRDRPASLHRALASVRSQTYPALEIVVVDDGSTQPVEPEVVADHPPTRLVRLEPSRGPGAARNAGVEAASGELLAFLDDDDEWLPASVERRVNALIEAGPSFAGAQCGWEMRESGDLRFSFVPDPDRDLQRTLLRRPSMAPSSVLIRKSAFIEAGGFDASLSQYEDWDLWLRVADRYDVTLVPELLVRRELHSDRDLRAIRLYARQQMWERIGPRIERLDPLERRSLKAHHLAELAFIQSELGEYRAARRALAAAWLQQPWSLRHATGIARSVLGNTSLWASAGKVKRVLRRNGGGVEPPVLSW
ncbi:MAG TPA: glycosyltransferase family A protein [Actinomycetota bacterium]|nr:glycosyltransferase family A protein [Actinomycetota bacterium]